MMEDDLFHVNGKIFIIMQKGPRKNPSGLFVRNMMTL